MSLSHLNNIVVQSESRVLNLKTKLVFLKQLYDQKAKENEKEQIQKLTQDNDKLREDIKQLKYNLNYIKVQKGATLVPLPKKTKVTLTEEQTVPVVDKPKETQAPVKSKADEKKAAKSSAKAPAKEAAADEKKPIDVSRLDMRVGKIINVEKHPDADSLYIEKVDLGEEKPRTIISGLVKFLKIEEMQDRVAIFMCNLKPVKMRGIFSEGMIMCASTPENVEPLTPPSSAVIGDRIVCQDYPGEPDKQLNPKKKVWEQVQPNLLVDAKGVAGYKGSPLQIQDKGLCVAKVMKNCPIK